MASSFLLEGVGWRDHARRLSHFVVNTILPPACANCGKPGELFCADCHSEVHWVNDPICASCGRPQSAPISSCFQCMRKPLPLILIRSATLYSDPVKKVIQKFKYEGYFALDEPLSNLMYTAWSKWRLSPNLVIPIPLHQKRMKERGYNQSELLVNALGKQLGWHIDPNALERKRQTRPQVGLSADERQQNVRGAFSADKEKVAGKDVMLVDDLFTTGSTLDAAAQVLLEAGTKTVTAYCLATAF